MQAVFTVTPIDDAWCLKIGDTSELLFFPSGGQAEREALALARQAIAAGRQAKVFVHVRDESPTGHWANGS
jgi:hypothetical protein